MIKIKKALITTLLILFLLLAMLATWVYSQFDSALPQLEGKATIIGLNHNVQIHRDASGIPTIMAKNRHDTAVATGFLHAQERFFQMDLLRRNSAGELSSLFGEAALEYDKSIRLHRFRQRAAAIIKQLPKDQKELLTAYTLGVNEGLRSLKADPFEYLLLQQSPVEWQEEDSVLTVLSMYLDLQYKNGDRERSLGLLKSQLPESVYAFLNPKGSRWDAAIDDSQYSPAPLPNDAWSLVASNIPLSNPKQLQATDYSSEEFPGSNNWAVAGTISSTGSAIVANDMHLGIRVPNTWYRASFEYTSTQQESIKVTGLTLPGTPAMVTGSNGNIAWGFTNSYGDWNDVIILKTNREQTQYLTPEGYQDFSYHKQIIAVKNQQPVEISVKETQWGPVIASDAQGQLLAYRWVAHDLEAVNFFAKNLELTKNVDQAFSIAAQSGIPAQNMMVGDKQGNIGWTIMGAIPIRSQQFGETPTDWSNGDNQWQGYLAQEDYPKVKNPEHHRLWTANSRVVGGKMLDIIGNGGYALGARSQQIRDDLFAKTLFDEKALLDIALDDRAIFLERWRRFLLDQVLTQAALGQNTLWQEAHSQLLKEPFTASVDSVGYRITRNFRIKVRDALFSALNESLEQVDDSYSFRTIRHQIETPLWQLITQQPPHALPNAQNDWQQLFTDALTATLTDMIQDQPLSQATWGQQNTTSIQHPLTKGVKLLSGWLNMPATPLAGDSYMPRVQGKSFGASQRMVVSPGHEESGILHMPTSQAGHPWSPYYGLGHKDWEQGNPSPFLPGKTKYSLTLLSY